MQNGTNHTLKGGLLQHAGNQGIATASILTLPTSHEQDPIQPLKIMPKTNLSAAIMHDFLAMKVVFLLFFILLHKAKRTSPADRIIFMI